MTILTILKFHIFIDCNCIFCAVTLLLSLCFGQSSTSSLPVLFGVGKGLRYFNFLKQNSIKNFNKKFPLKTWKINLNYKTQSTLGEPISEWLESMLLHFWCFLSSIQFPAALGSIRALMTKRSYLLIFLSLPKTCAIAFRMGIFQCHPCTHS